MSQSYQAELQRPLLFGRLQIQQNEVKSNEMFIVHFSLGSINQKNPGKPSGEENQRQLQSVFDCLKCLKMIVFYLGG